MAKPIFTDQMMSVIFSSIVLGLVDKVAPQERHSTSPFFCLFY